jgi:hypothetical protein
MCLGLYLASSIPLPLIPWVEEAPSICISELECPPYDPSVKGQFTLPHFYYVGSHMGCGCGFVRNPWEEGEGEQIEANYMKLADYVGSARARGADLQLFSCWSGDEAAEPEARHVVSANALLDPEFEFEEKAFYGIE